MSFTYEEVLQASEEYFDGDDLAAKVFVDKYALRSSDGNYIEKTPSDMHRRLAREFARIEHNKFKNPISEDEIFNLFDHFKYIIPQGSVLYGCGNNEQIVSLSNCFVVSSPEDSYGGILQTDEQLVQISKRRGGVGIDLSKLRPAGFPTKNSSRKSTGIKSWMRRYSNSIREVGQDGRRGALMITLSCHHPDILEFINIKNDPNEVTGANISVKYTDEFLKAVEEDTVYQLRFPVDSTNIVREISAKQVWDAAIYSAWNRAEPGALFWDNITSYNMIDCYKDEGFGTESTNPCCHAKDKDVFVLTNLGYIEIKEVTPDHLIWVTDVFVDHWAKTSGYFDAGKSEIFEVTFSNDDIFHITKNHKLAVVGGYGSILDLIPLALLKEGDEILCDKGNIVTITNIKSIGIKEVGCIHVYNYNFFITKSGIISGNSELPLCEHDSCRLLIQNLFSYVVNPFTKNAYFDYGLFQQHVEIAQRLMDDLIDLEIEKIKAILNKLYIDPEHIDIKSREINLWENILDKCVNGRRTGLGVTGEGDALAALGLQYGSQESIWEVEKIHKFMKWASFGSSVNMAVELGPFPVWDWEKEKDSPFLLLLKKERKDIYQAIKKYGRRNIGNLTIAPTGSMSLLAQTTSGIEPLFMLEPYKRRKKINPSDKNARVDFVDPSGDSWQEFDVIHPKLKLWMDITGETDWRKSPWYGCCAEDLDWTQRVKLQAVAQRHIDHAISSTLNLPEDVSLEKVDEIFRTAWKAGCKGITVYRKNCRTGVLVEKNILKFLKRPKELPCDVYHVTIKGKPHTVCVSLFNSNPYEVLVIGEKTTKGAIRGNIIKRKRGWYDLYSLEGELIYENITGWCTSEEANITRLISTGLRHNIPVDYLLDQLSKMSGDINGFARSISKCLKKYVKDDTPTTDKCPECEGGLIYKEGCKSCACGWSKC